MFFVLNKKESILEALAVEQHIDEDYQLQKNRKPPCCPRRIWIIYQFPEISTSMAIQKSHDGTRLFIALMEPVVHAYA